jgi:hypothetical protein
MFLQKHSKTTSMETGKGPCKKNSFCGGDVKMEVVDLVQKCINLMEAIYYAQHETRAYRMHCHDITWIVCKLWPTIVEAQQQNPNLGEVFETFKIELEATLLVMNKCCTMTQFDKLLD